MSNNTKTGQLTNRTLLYNTLITGLIATCAVVAINATYIILFLYGGFGSQILQNIPGNIIDVLLNPYLLIITLILGLCAPFIARIYPHNPALRRISWISATALLILPHITFFVFMSLWPHGLSLSGIIDFLWGLLYIFPLTLLYLFLLACALGETLYIERNPHVLAMWKGWDLRNITISILFPYYIFIILHIAIPLILFMSR